MLLTESSESKLIEEATQKNVGVPSSSDYENSGSDVDGFQTTQEEESYLDQYSGVVDEDADELRVRVKPVDQAMAEIKKDDHAALNTMLLNKLSPQLEENEVQKREFKRQITNYIIVVLSVQLGFFLLIVLIFSAAFCLDLPFLKDISIAQEQLEVVTTFLKYYITAIIAEFLAMLFFIVRFVFDKSIVTLVRDLFKKNE